MGVKSANQHLRVYVSTGAPVVAANQAALTALAVGRFTYVAEGTAVGTATPPTGKNFRVHYKGVDGNLFVSPTVKFADIVKSTIAVAGANEVQQVDTLAIANAIAGKSYFIKLRVPNYGGMISPQDEVYFYGNYTAKAGDTTALIAAGLRASLKKACDAAPVPFANITGATNKIIATGVVQKYVRSKWDGRLVNFDLTLSHPETEMGGAVKTTAGKAGTGTGKQVASMEEFYAGYNEGFKNRGGNYPYDTEPTLAADVSKLYKADTIIFKTKQDGSNDMSQRQTIMIFHTPA